MLRSLPYLLAVVISGCAVNENDQFVFCFHGDCEEPDQPDHLPPGQPNPPVTFSYDMGVFRAPSSTLARGGVLHVDVESKYMQTPVVTESDAAISLVPISSTTHLTRIDVHGDAIGSATIDGSIPALQPRVPLTLRVAELASVGISVPERAPSDHLVVLPDVTEVALSTLDADGGVVLDHSFAIDPSSAPGFVLTSDVVGLPHAIGDHPLVLTRATGDRYPLRVRVVDAVDEIVADDFTQGRLCVHPVVGADRVETSAWTFAGVGVTVVPTDRADCIDFVDPTPGAKIMATVANKTVAFPVL